MFTMKNIKPVGCIRLDLDNEKLVINIESINEKSLPVAFILNYSGEVLEKFELIKGTNFISRIQYATKNYSIRIVNDKNVITQKI